MAPVAAMAEVTLGKMLQPAQKLPTDELRPYLRAAHIQPNGLLDRSVEPKEMWFSTAEVAALDLRRGDVLVVEGGAVGRSTCLQQDLPEIGFQNSIIRVRPAEHSDGRFLDYALQAAVNAGAIEAECSTVSMAHFTAEKVSRFRVPFASLGEQRRIAEYLDRETAEIDAMDAELNHLINTLNERRATASTALFGGPDYGLDTEQGRIVGRFPDSWRTTRFDVAFPATDERNGDTPLGPMLSVSEYRGIEPRKYGEREAPRSPNEVTHYRVVRPGQIVANIMWLNHSGIGVSDYLGYTSPDYRVYNVSQAVLPRYAHHLLRTADYRAAFTAIGEGVRPNAQRANTVLLGMLPVPLPPLDEQYRIVAELDEATARIDDMIADAQRLKALLAERRSTLITEVVTGAKEIPA